VTSTVTLTGPELERVLAIQKLRYEVVPPGQPQHFEAPPPLILYRVLMFSKGMISVVEVVKPIFDVLPRTLTGILRFVRTRSQYASANIPANSTKELIKYIQT